MVTTDLSEGGIAVQLPKKQKDPGPWQVSFTLPGSEKVIEVTGEAAWQNPGGQVGIRGPLYGPEDFAFQDQHGMEVIRIEAVKEQGVPWAVERLARLRGGPVYISFDIDAVDPAYAPATGTPEVGGLTSYEALALLRGLAGMNLVGGDVVEVSPPYDGPGQVTSLLAANLMFEIVTLFALAPNGRAPA